MKPTPSSKRIVDDNYILKKKLEIFGRQFIEEERKINGHFGYFRFQSK